MTSQPHSQPAPQVEPLDINLVWANFHRTVGQSSRLGEHRVSTLLHEIKAISRQANLPTIDDDILRDPRIGAFIALGEGILMTRRLGEVITTDRSRAACVQLSNNAPFSGSSILKALNQLDNAIQRSTDPSQHSLTGRRSPEYTALAAWAGIKQYAQEAISDMGLAEKANQRIDDLLEIAVETLTRSNGTSFEVELLSELRNLQPVLGAPADNILQDPRLPAFIAMGERALSSRPLTELIDLAETQSACARLTRGDAVNGENILRSLASLHSAGQLHPQASSATRRASEYATFTAWVGIKRFAAITNDATLSANATKQITKVLTFSSETLERNLGHLDPNDSRNTENLGALGYLVSSQSRDAAHFDRSATAQERRPRAIPPLGFS